VKEKINQIEFDKRFRLALSGVALVALTILIETGKLAEHGGYELFAYVVGYIVGGQFGPSITIGRKKDKDTTNDKGL
jgi:hypothetical protein